MIASEIFEFDSSLISSLFHEINEDNEENENINQNSIKNNLLDYFFSFLDSKYDLNETLSGYFQKVFFSIYQKKTKEVKIF